MTPREWELRGAYFEACSCQAICPCRSVGGRKGGRSTYGVCDFALGWTIEAGRADDVELTGLEVVMAGSYDDDEAGSPWRVVLYLDARANADQRAALEAIFVGRAGGTPLRNFAHAIGEVYAVRSARIGIDHSPPRRGIRASNWVEVVEREPVPTIERVSCAIPGHEHPGEEVVVERLAVRDGALQFELRGRCGFATSFAYAGDR